MLTKLNDALTKFVEERQWGDYHTTKTMALALSCEVAELVALFAFVSEEASYDLKGSELHQEIGDVMNNLVWVCDALKLPLEKFETVKNGEREPFSGSPKDLIIVLSAKMGRFMEHFLWSLPEEAIILKPPIERDLIELFQLFLTLCEKLSIDPIKAAWEKLALNEKKYPAIIVKNSIDAYFARKAMWKNDDSS